MSVLYLVPTPLSVDDVTSQRVRDVIVGADYFIVENVRTARRFIAGLKLGVVIDQLEFVEFSEHSGGVDLGAILAPVVGGRVGVLMSEAGLPCVADPGAVLVGEAHRRGVRVVPLVGGSSMMLALMASGAGGQSFAFNGYLPIKSEERSKALKKFEGRAHSEGQSQIFIETPYRNSALFADMLKVLQPTTMLSVACDLTSAEELVISKSVAQGRSVPVPNIQKRPTIFIVFSGGVTRVRDKGA